MIEYYCALFFTARLISKAFFAKAILELWVIPLISKSRPYLEVEDFLAKSLLNWSLCNQSPWYQIEVIEIIEIEVIEIEVIEIEVIEIEVIEI